MQDKDYRSHFGISQSAIKDFQFKSPKKWKGIWIDQQIDLDKNEDNFTMGSLIDTILFSPSELSKRFYVGEEKLPSKAIAAIVKSYYNTLVASNKMYEEMNKDIPEEIPLKEMSLIHVDMLIEAANQYCYKVGDEEKCGWNTQWKDETRVRSLVENGSDYFKSLAKAAGRKIISHEMNLEAINLVGILNSDPEVMAYFVPTDGNTLMFQMELYITVEIDGKMVPLKGALDILRFNHIDRTVQIADFKSSYSAFGFVHSIKQFGYCDQLSYYDFLLREWLKHECVEYCDYTVIPPVNIVIDINDRIPYLYEYDWRDIALAADGNKDFLYSLYQTNDHNVRIKKGWKRLLEDIAWHIQTGQWDKPRELYETKRIKVNLLNS